MGPCGIRVKPDFAPIDPRAGLGRLRELLLNLRHPLERLLSGAVVGKLMGLGVLLRRILNCLPALSLYRAGSVRSRLLCARALRW